MTCTHERKRFCKFRYEVKGETRHHKACQCLDCGQRVKSPTGGIWWPLDRDEKIEAMPYFDLELLDDCTRRDDRQRRERYVEQRKSEFLARHEEYERYLQSEQWRFKRDLILTRCGHKCECCLLNSATQVHHINYKTLFDEVAWDLRGVCVDCHKRLHNIFDANGFGTDAR